MKKYLSLLLAMLMLVTSLGMNSFAADYECAIHDTETVTVYPTCTERGYDYDKCKNCDYVGVQKNPREPLGHQMDEGVFVPVNNGEYFIKKFSCTRQYRVDNDTETCKHSVIEMENNKEVIYYLVSFVNDKVVTETKMDLNGVEFINTEKFGEKTLATYYVKAGTAGEYKTFYPALGKTAAFGEHKFDGWTETKGLEIKESYDSSIYAAIDAPVTRNTVFYPVFVGLQVKYPVTFFDAYGNRLTNPQNVIHGNSPVYRVNGDPAGSFYNEPTKKDDIRYYYDFAGWSTKHDQEIGFSTLSLEKVPVYMTTSYRPAYKPEAKNYRVEFYSYDKKLMASFDDINLGSDLLTDLGAPLENINNPAALVKPSTASVIYEWTGKWRVLQKTDIEGKDTYGSAVDLRNFSINSTKDYHEVMGEEGNVVTVRRKVAVHQLDHNGEVIRKAGEKITREEPLKVIRLVPVYEEIAIVYHVGIIMDIPDSEDKDYYLGGAAVRIFDHNNNIVASGKTGADGTFVCKLKYNEKQPYTVKITTADSKYIGEAQLNATFQRDPGGDAEYEAMMLNVRSVTMTRNPEYETNCSCIHHNPLIQPIWVRILNILYTFFNVRYECCFDMYSTIGPLLDYTKE